MVGSTVGSRWQVLQGLIEQKRTVLLIKVGGRYCTVRYFSRWPVLSAAAAAAESYWCGELSNASTVPYRTMAVSRYCRTCYSYRTLVSHSFRDKD